MSAIFEVLVKYGSRELVKLELTDTSTVLNLQEAITETFDVAPEHQKIVFRGKTLSDPNATLTSAGLTNKCKVMLVNSTPPPPPPPPPVPAPVSIPTPLIDFATRQPRARRDEYMTAPPHSGIIARGPPEGAMEGNNYQATTLPLDPLVVRDSTGDVAKLAFRSDDLVVDSETNHHRIFYQEITSYGIQEIPGHEQRYVALGLQIKGQKLWVYFIPKQYRNVIESVVLHRRI